MHGNPEDAAVYLKQLQDWNTAHADGEPMGFPFPWDISRCGIFGVRVGGECEFKPV